MSPRPRHAFLFLAIATTYYAAAKLGLTLATDAEQVSIVWPPSGIALAACLLFGKRVWPAVWLGAFVANATAHEPLVAAGAIATGNTAAALLGAWLLERIGKFDLGIGRIHDAFALLLLGGLSVVVSATIGPATLCVAGLQPWSAFDSLYKTWWMGDAMGILVITPFVLGLAEIREQRWDAARILEGLLLLVGMIGVCLFAFRYEFAGFLTLYPLGYTIFPLLIWVAVRFGLPGTSTGIVVASAVAVWTTVQGTGPFVGRDQGHGLALVQVFMGVVGTTILLLGAAINERKTANARRAAEHGVTQALANADSLERAARRILEAICNDLEWDMGALWRIDPQHGRRVLLDMFHAPGVATPRLDAVCATPLPAVVCHEAWNGAVWPDSERKDGVGPPHTRIAREEGLRSCAGFPVLVDGALLAIAEFFSRRRRLRDPEMTRTFAAIATEVSQYLVKTRVEGERERAVQALRQSEERMRSILDHAPLAVSIKDLDGRYVFVNSVSGTLLSELAGGKPIVGKTDAELFPAATAEALQALDRRAIAARGPIQIEETTPASVGARSWLTSVFPLATPAGERYGLCRIAADITSLKEAEGKLKEADRKKDEFLATLAHELRNPLAPVRNAVEILRAHGPSEPKLQWAGDVIERQVAHLARLVDDLLDVARITTSKVRLDLAPVAIANVIASAVEAVRPEVERRRHRLSVSVPERPIEVEADLVRLSQVVGNLLDNAAKYTESGGDIALVVEEIGDAVEIRVKDSGIGMPAEFLPVVFDLFAQADRSLDRARGGLGIGLTLVRRLVEMHRGTVEAKSAGPGRGSEFVVRLPVLRLRTEPLAGERAPAPKTPAARRRILVVDDNVDSAESVRELLSMDGHDVAIAHDGKQALEIARSSIPEVVLLDIGLPGMDGYEVARRMRSEQTLGKTLLIAITGYARDDDRRRASEAGFDLHMRKPVDLKALRRIVAEKRH